ncbi:Aminodeoxychorismate synthase [Podospora fimiseda]|uniref:aminodeoxychorismate synthase n=1 Tax=Podospora fimiseda TaxID=252190 RepID=A0AAN7BUK2_9PEZI|nr:Aminodeoxychorismate synthase [Podospora fimiseda]
MSPENPKPQILFLDAYDSFSNNITSLLTILLSAEVSVLPIDFPISDSDFASELSRYDAVICGPGPGNPYNQNDVGLINRVWEYDIPVLGICLGFQSLVVRFGGKVDRVKGGGLHGMVRAVEFDNEKEDIFKGVGKYKATLYHSLCGELGRDNRELKGLAWLEGEQKLLMGVRHEIKPFWGVQYHPESVCTGVEGNKVIENWWEEARRWNEERGRKVVTGEKKLAGAATRRSLLSLLGGTEEEERKDWWEEVEIGAVLNSVTVPLARGAQVPDVVEAVETEGGERIVLDSANAAPATSRADVRGRYSIVAAGLDEALRIEHHTGDEYAMIRVKSGKGLSVNLSQQVPVARYGGIWGLIAKFQEARRQDVDDGSNTPFVGGFMGYITYEQGLADIGVPLDQPRPHHRPDVCLAWVTKSIVVDHLLGVVHVQHLRSTGSMDDTWMEKTARKLISLQNTQRRPSFNLRKDPLSPRSRRLSKSTSVQTPMTKEYEDKVRICQEYIAAGESYELCLTDQTTITCAISDKPLANANHPVTPTQTQQRKKRRSSSSASLAPPSSWSLYKLLRTRQPAPFASYLRLGEATLVSASPERFLTYDRSGLCSMRPMKGTVRKSEAVSTLEQAEKILHVPKEEAENLMIVDLVRHDLHAICGAGNVTVPELLKVEEYQSVFQMITVVEGQLPNYGEKRGYTGLDVLAVSLPPGSMTGAPKKRSCEILKEIEGHKERSLYSGVVGYMCASGRGDWSVTIRSLFRWDDEQVVVDGEEGEEKQEVWRIGAGGAVTILSTPDGEREEMFTKLAGPLRVFGEAR